jgi:hypothetical protein
MTLCALSHPLALPACAWDFCLSETLKLMAETYSSKGAPDAPLGAESCSDTCVPRALWITHSNGVASCQTVPGLHPSS